MLASLEWIYWEALSLLMGTLGTVALSIHTIPTQVVTLAFMIPYGIGMALSIRVGANLSHQVERAQVLTALCLATSATVFAIGAWLMYVFRQSIWRIFTQEEAVLQGCADIWPHVCIFYFVLSMFGINLGVATGLGMQWTLGIITIVFMWVLGLPTTYYVAVWRQGGIQGAWATIWPAYLGINIVIVTAFVRTDWHAISRAIRIREGIHQSTDDKHINRNGDDEGSDCVSDDSSSIEAGIQYGSIKV
jgi:multidrug resistance protein, MATE family